jgi:hypothetical protein
MIPPGTYCNRSRCYPAGRTCTVVYCTVQWYNPGRQPTVSWYRHYSSTWYVRNLSAGWYCATTELRLACYRSSSSTAATVQPKRTNSMPVADADEHPRAAAWVNPHRERLYVPYTLNGCWESVRGRRRSVVLVLLRQPLRLARKRYVAYYVMYCIVETLRISIFSLI